MVNHFKGRIHYYALWNEQDIGYWNPYGNPEEYGRLLAAFAPAAQGAPPWPLDDPAAVDLPEAAAPNPLAGLEKKSGDPSGLALPRIGSNLRNCLTLK